MVLTTDGKQMRWNLYSGNLNPTLPYASEVTSASIVTNIPTCLLYAICWHESIQGEINGSWIAATVVSADGGHGLGQLTSSYPENWDDPYSNACWAATYYIIPAAEYWVNQVTDPGALVKCIAATYNAGLGNAIAGHAQNNVDLYTTNNYGAVVETIYFNLLTTGNPT